MTQAQKQAFDALTASGIFYGHDETETDGTPWERIINLNDTLAWGCADGETVEFDDMIDLNALNYRYGWCGVLYWVFGKRGLGKCEFHDVNRMVDFVRNEERIRQEIPGDSKRAYHKTSYTISNS